jgi:protein-S-isoprenylcysteine O-methyltransferase Ste14
MEEPRKLKFPIPAMVVPVVVVLLYLFVPGVRERPWTAWRLGGAAFAAAGYILFVISRIQLGNSFSVSAQAKGLVTHGFYARIRNPIYLFVGVMWGGLIVALHLYWLFIPLFALLVMQVIRAGKEAKILQTRFGQAYLDYREQTWF